MLFKNESNGGCSVKTLSGFIRFESGEVKDLDVTEVMTSLPPCLVEVKEMPKPEPTPAPTEVPTPAPTQKPAEAPVEKPAKKSTENAKEKPAKKSSKKAAKKAAKTVKAADTAKEEKKQETKEEEVIPVNIGNLNLSKQPLVADVTKAETDSQEQRLIDLQETWKKAAPAEKEQIQKEIKALQKQIDRVKKPEAEEEE